MALAIAMPIHGQPLSGTFTADNAYELWSGTETAVLSRLAGVENCSASGIRSAETFSATVSSSATHLFLIAYSDDGVAQGVLGDLFLDGRRISTGDAVWEVFATGDGRDPACAGGVGPPSAAEIDAEIAIANAGSGNGATTSRGWVDAQGGGVGRLAVGAANQSPAGGPISEVIGGIGDQARWMWFAPPGVDDPFTTGGDYREMLIFRMPLVAAERCTQRPPYRFEWYPFDETEPSTANEIVLGRNGTWIGNPIPVEGRVGGALSFPGNADWVDSANGGYPGNASGDLTIDLWVRNDPQAGVRALLDWRLDDGTGPRGYSLFLFNGQLGFQLANGNGSATCGSVASGGACTNWVANTARIDDGEWHFIAISIDRDASDGLRFYIDGDLALTVDPTGRQGDLRTTAPLRFGRNSDTVLLDGDFDGALDEVEIFPVALSEADLDRIYEAGRAGKCKETIDAPWDESLCDGGASTTPTINICNDGGSEHSYDLRFAPLAPQTRRCDVPGPTDFTVQGDLPITVPPFQCRGVKVVIARPPGLTDSGDVACYQVALENLDTGIVQVDDGSIQAQDDVCVEPCRTAETVTFDTVTAIPFKYEVFEPVTSFFYRVEVFGDDMEPDTEVISLDGQAPGEPVIGSLNLAAGDRGEIAVGVTAMDPDAIGEFFDIVWSIDTDGDGELETVTSSSVRVSESACIDGLGALCLNDDRFKVQVRWTDFEGVGGTGEAVPLTSDTGTLWFFDDANVELMVKVLDGRSLNDHWWVFYGALSNVAFELVVTDTVTGASKTFENALGEFASVGDTEAFFDPLDGAVVEPRPRRAESIATSTATPLHVDSAAFAGFVPEVAEQTACVAGDEALCLNQERFRVEVEWIDFSGGSGVGQAVPLTGDTGTFWFFDPANLELVVKVLDGRAINGNYWVFYGALSSVEYQITVTDTATNATRVYTNPSGTFASNGDTAAFEEP